jgi:hypothetical protein
MRTKVLLGFYFHDTFVFGCRNKFLPFFDLPACCHSEQNPCFGFRKMRNYIITMSSSATHLKILAPQRQMDRGQTLNKVRHLCLRGRRSATLSNVLKPTCVPAQNQNDDGVVYVLIGARVHFYFEYKTSLLRNRVNGSSYVKSAWKKERISIDIPGH